MLVPETAMHKDYFASRDEHQVWLSGESGDVKAIAET